MTKKTLKDIIGEGYLDDMQTKDTVAFVAKHVVDKEPVKKDKKVGTDNDQVFQASGTKKVKLAPHHGHEPEMAKSVYEAASRSLFSKEMHAKLTAMDSKGRRGHYNDLINFAQRAQEPDMRAKALKAAKELKRKYIKENNDEQDDGWYTHREIHGDKGISKEDWKKGWRLNIHGKRVQTKKEEVERIEELNDKTFASMAKNDLMKTRKAAKAEVKAENEKKANEEVELVAERNKENKFKKDLHVASTGKKAIEKFDLDYDKMADEYGHTRDQRRDTMKSQLKTYKRVGRQMAKEESEQIDEISKEGALNYIGSASYDKSSHASDIGAINQIARTTGTNASQRDERDKLSKKHGKRSWGIQMAAAKLAGKHVKVKATEEVEHIEEKTLTAAEKTKRKEIADAIKRDHPEYSDEKKMKIATAQAIKVAESTDMDSYLKAISKVNPKRPFDLAEATTEFGKQFASAADAYRKGEGSDVAKIGGKDIAIKYADSESQKKLESDRAAALKAKEDAKAKEEPKPAAPTTPVEKKGADLEATAKDNASTSRPIGGSVLPATKPTAELPGVVAGDKTPSTQFGPRAGVKPPASSTPGPSTTPTSQDADSSQGEGKPTTNFMKLQNVAKPSWAKSTNAGLKAQLTPKFQKGLNKDVSQAAGKGGIIYKEEVEPVNERMKLNIAAAVAARQTAKKAEKEKDPAKAAELKKKSDDYKKQVREEIVSLVKVKAKERVKAISDEALQKKKQ